MRSLSSRYRSLTRSIRSRLYGAFDCETDIIALHSYRLLYFAIPKVANTSLKLTFSRILSRELPASLIGNHPDDRTRRSLFRRDSRPLMYDYEFLLCKHQLHRFVAYGSFAFVRNPWDRLVSCYTNKLERVDLSQGPAGRDTLKSLSEEGYFSEDMSFADFARAVCNIPDERANRHYRSQHTFITARDGTLLPDRILYFEELSERFTELAHEFGLPDVSLPHHKPGRRRDYRSYFDPALREAVGRRYARDIELFGYMF